MKIAFFDFDGTITYGDSFAKFLRFALGTRFYIKILQNLHILILYKLNIIDNATTKQKILQSCLGGKSWSEISKKCDLFVDFLENYCKQSAKSKLFWHKSEGHKVAIVSASFEQYLRPLARKWGIDLMASSMEIKDGVITGRFDKPNCYGAQKVARIKEKYDLSEFECVYVYGDTRGDKEMLELASPNCGFYRIFK